MGGQSGVDVAVIGAGPYGLSIAAHLARRGVGVRVFGPPMQTWRRNMPRGMFLKSPAFGSSLSDPSREHTLERFCALHGLEYDDRRVPVPSDVFIRYGRWFQERLVPTIDTNLVESCQREGGGFLLRCQGGAQVRAKSVVVSSGYAESARLPEELLECPKDLVSHSSAHADLGTFRGQQVIVLGAGQSALEGATLLKETGAIPTLVARRKSLKWVAPPPGPRPLHKRLRRPETALGVGLRYAFYQYCAPAFRRLPARVRRRHVEGVLGPAGACWLKPRLEGQIPVELGWDLRCAQSKPGRIALQFCRDGERLELHADHVIAATGYRVSPASFPFLSSELRKAIRWQFGSPVLSMDFESSVPGLYFAGLAAAYSFGPAMRFVAGAEIAAPRLCQRLSSTARRF